MKLLLCIPSIELLTAVFDFVQAGEKLPTTFSTLTNSKLSSPILYSFLKNGVTCDVLLMGNTAHEASFRLGAILASQKYHLVLHLNTAVSIVESIPVGEIVSVINDKSGVFIYNAAGEIQTLYQAGMLDSKEFPHIRGGYINMTNAYFNVFLDFKKVVNISANTYDIFEKQLQFYTQKLLGQVVNEQALSVSYPALWHGAAFYQIFAVSENKITSEKNVDLAVQKLTETFISIFTKIQ